VAALFLQLNPGHMQREELVQTAFLLLVAGNATVSGMIALGLLELFKHPDQLELLKVRIFVITLAGRHYFLILIAHCDAFIITSRFGVPWICASASTLMHQPQFCFFLQS
jgi:hypothetical protein